MSPTSTIRGWRSFCRLLFLPFAHEDLAILLGGYLVVNRLMPIGLVVVTIYLGMVVSDLALYGIGAGARRVPWLGRLAVNGCVKSFGDTLQRNLLGLSALGRVVPGVVFVVMIACGWARVPLTRVALASLVTSALYLPLMLYLVIVFGDAMDDRAGLVDLAVPARSACRRRLHALPRVHVPRERQVRAAAASGTAATAEPPAPAAASAHPAVAIAGVPEDAGVPAGRTRAIGRQTRWTRSRFAS